MAVDNHQPCELVCEDVLSEIPPAVWVQGHLLSIQQQLRRIRELTAAQRRCVLRITGEAVTRGRSASDELTRAFGAWDARDRSPGTLATLQDFDAKLRELSLVLRSQAAEAKDVSAEVAIAAVPERPAHGRRRPRLFERGSCFWAATAGTAVRPRQRRGRLCALAFSELCTVEAPSRPTQRQRRPRLFAREFFHWSRSC